MPSAGYLTQILNVKTVKKQKGVASISSESSKIHLLKKVLYIWYKKTFADVFLFHHPQIVSLYQQRNFITSLCPGLKA